MKNCEKEKSTYSDEVTYTTYPQFIQFYRYICQVASAPLSTIAVCLSPNMLQMFHFHQNCLRHRIYLGAVLPTYLYLFCGHQLLKLKLKDLATICFGEGGPYSYSIDCTVSYGNL